jgi:hypothetical protein
VLVSKRAFSKSSVWAYVGVVYTIGMCMYMSDNCLSLLTSHKHAPNARHDRHHRDPPLHPSVTSEPCSFIYLHCLTYMYKRSFPLSNQ